MAKNNSKRHGWRNLFITILSLSLLGVILLGVGAIGVMMETGKLTFDALNLQFGAKGEAVYESYSYAADPNIIDSIELEFDDRRIEIIESTGDQILLEFYASQYDTVEVREDRTAFIGKLDSGNHFFFFHFDLFSIFNPESDEDKTVVLYLPAAYIGDLDVETSNGSIKVEGFDRLGNVELETSNGAVTVCDITLDRLELKTSNGRVELEDIFSDALIAKISNGAIGAYSVRAHETLSLTTSNGRIEIEYIDSNNIILKSSNGSIKGSIAQSRSDFTISSDTSNGSNNLESGGSGYKKLTVKTSNADIDIAFNK